MKVLTGAGLAFGFLSLVQAHAEPVVDRLISKRYEETLEKRHGGFSNGGNRFNAGKGPNGKPRNRDNFEISFYHINDVHAYVVLVAFLRFK